jgi:hypothetical protein
MYKQISGRGAGFQVSNGMGGLDGCYSWGICIFVYVWGGLDLDGKDRTVER